MYFLIITSIEPLLRSFVYNAYYSYLRCESLNMNCFKKGYDQLNIFNCQDGQQGLYQNQIGAIGAALAHFSVRNEPALITMPTGTGKTAVMIVLSYAMKANRILVVTPSQLVRAQIAEHFRNPKLLIEKGIISGEESLPRVYELTSIINESSNWENILNSYDAVIGIPGTISQITNIEETIGKDAFDIIFVDEAHHSRAKTWTNILESFPQAKKILLTATPFRRDRKDIKARLIYNYSLKQAYEEKLFSKINLVSVNTNLFNSEDDKNIAIAKKAQDIYNARLHPDHKIIIRTDKRKNAENLHRIYTKYTQLKLEVIHSKLTDKIVKARIKNLITGVIDGIICVDMMGEGYDFPALKIAAVHIPHKSLAITLQFIGRISRTNITAGEEATVIAGEHEFMVESYQLYKQDSKDWSIVLPDLHKAKIQKTEDEQEFFDSFEDVAIPESYFDIDIESNDLVDIEDDDLRPFFHAKLYSIIPTISHGHVQSEEDENDLIDIHANIDFSGTDILNNPVMVHHHVSTSHNVAVYIISELKTPSWYNGNNTLRDIKNELFITYFDKDNSILFICSSLKDNELYEHIVKQYLCENVVHDMIPLPLLKRAMAGWGDPKIDVLPKNWTIVN